MDFTVKSREELEREKEAKMGLVPEGIYTLTIEEAKDDISKKSGNPMLVITFSVSLLNSLDQEVKYQIREYITPNQQYRLMNLCEALGMMEQYNSGSLPSYLLQGKVVQARVIVQKDPNGQYKDSNRIGSYIPNIPQDAPKLPKIAPAAAVLDDECPF